MADSDRMPLVTAHPRGSMLSVTVVPRAGKSSLERLADGTLRVRVTAPPVDGAANAALLSFLANALDLSRSRLAIASGASSRRKRIVVEGVSPDALAKSLDGALRKGV
jgi:hypothetical protein